jgi:hypothetical protein
MFVPMTKSKHKQKYKINENKHKHKHKINEKKQIKETILIRMQQLKYITQFHDFVF